MYLHIARRLMVAQAKSPCVFFVCYSWLAIIHNEGTQSMEYLGSFQNDKLGVWELARILDLRLGWDARKTFTAHHIDNKAILLKLTKSPGKRICDLCLRDNSAMIVMGWHICRICAENIKRLIPYTPSD